MTEPQASAAQLVVYSNVNAGPNSIGTPAIVTTRGVSEGPCRQELLDGVHEMPRKRSAQDPTRKSNSPAPPSGDSQRGTVQVRLELLRHVAFTMTE